MIENPPDEKPGLFDEGTLSQKILLAVLGIGVVGLCVAVLGIVIGHDTIYHVGLYVAAPLYIIVLPMCLVLVGLLFVVCLVQVMVVPWRWLVQWLNR